MLAFSGAFKLHKAYLDAIGVDAIGVGPKFFTLTPFSPDRELLQRRLISRVHIVKACGGYSFVEGKGFGSGIKDVEVVEPSRQAVLGVCARPRRVPMPNGSAGGIRPTRPPSARRADGSKTNASDFDVMAVQRSTLQRSLP